MPDPTSLDRLLYAVRRIIKSQFPRLPFMGTYEYTITATDGTTVDCTPNDTTTGLPALSKVPIRDDAISSHKPTVGNLCHVVFLNGGDPSVPICTWTQPNPVNVAIGGGSIPMVIQGNQIQAFLPPTLPVVGTVSGSPFTGTITITNPITGVVTQGSSYVAGK